MTPMNLSLDMYFTGISKLNNFSSVPINNKRAYIVIRSERKMRFRAHRPVSGYHLKEVTEL